MFNSTVYLLCIFLAILGSVYSAENTQHNIAKNEKHFFRVFFNSPNSSLEFFQSENIKSSQAKFSPNSQVQTELTIGHQGYTLGYSFKGKAGDSKKGNSTYSQYRFDMNYDKFHLNLFYQIHEGYYLETKKTETGSYLTFPNLSSQHIGLNLAYFFSKDYIRGIETIAFHELLKQSQKDKSFVRDSSWFARIGFDKNEIKNVPQDDIHLMTNTLSDYIEMTGGEFQSIYFLWGVDFYYIIDSFFIDTQFAVGTGYQKQKYISRGIRKESKDNPMTVHIDLSLGFYINDLVIGARIETQRIESQLEYKRGFGTSKENVGLFVSKSF